MSILNLITLFLEASVQYLQIRNKLAVYDTLEKFDAKLDTLEKKRETLRAKMDSISQKEADKVSTEILEEKKKLKYFLALLPVTEDNK